MSNVKMRFKRNALRTNASTFVITDTQRKNPKFSKRGTSCTELNLDRMLSVSLTFPSQISVCAILTNFLYFSKVNEGNHYLDL
jgi:hypothetical protein